MLKPGDRFGNVRVVRLLGEGGMGAVYAATDETTGRTVALKVLSPEAAARRGSQTPERFRREARAAASLAHPNVVTLHGVEHEGEALGLCFELVPGGSLMDRLSREGKIPWNEAVRLALDAARGLQAIHGLGLVHRDVKPQNLLVDNGGNVKVSDLGLARRTDSQGPHLTVAGQLLGTAEYLAPEGQGETPLGPAADLYALGATLHHMIAGQPPFVGGGFAILKQHILDAPPRLTAEVRGVPPALEALVLRLLAKEPAERGSIEQVIGELQALLRRPAPRRVVPVVAGVLALVVFGVTGVFLARTPRGGPATPAPAPVPATPPEAAPTPAPAPPSLRLGEQRRLEHPTPPNPRNLSYYMRSASLSHDGRFLVLGGASGRFTSWILDAASLEVVGDELRGYAATVADPERDVIYAGTPEGHVVAIERAYSPGRKELWRYRGPTDLAATIGVDALGNRVYVGFQGGPPDPVQVLGRASGELLEDVTHKVGTVMRILSDPDGHVFVNSHRGRYAPENFFLAHWTPGAKAFDLLDRMWALGVSPSGQVLLQDVARSRVSLLDPARSVVTPTEVPAGGGPIAGVSRSLVLVAVPGGVQLLSVPGGEPVGTPLDLPAPVNGQPARVAVFVADGARSRVLALLDDPTGTATRVVSIAVANPSR